MKLYEQRNELVETIVETEKSLACLLEFLQSNKFQGQGEDWIRTGEVWTVLRDIRNNLKWNRQEIVDMPF